MCDGFNPTMVRLLHGEVRFPRGLRILFQSHNGAIAAKLRSKWTVGNSDVSIPQWCDCCYEVNPLKAFVPCLVCVKVFGLIFKRR